MHVRSIAAACALAAGAFAAPFAYADDASSSEISELRRQLAAQERRLRELEGRSSTQDEIEAAVAKYVGSTPAVGVLVGGDDAGKAGFPSGGAPFISQGDNKINFHFRNQVRYSAFLYSTDAVGTRGTTPNALTGAEPRDRSGFELERFYFGVDGTVFCPNVTYNMTLNLDSDTGSGVEKEFMWIDWKYHGEHHIRGGVDKVPFTYEEQNSSASLAFVDRSMYAKAFALDSDTGVMLWGNFGPCGCEKQFLYKVMASNGEGNVGQQASVFNQDALDTYSDQLLFSAMLEWTITCKDWKFDEVDNRECGDRSRLDASIGIAGYYENDDDVNLKSPGMAVRSTGPLDRYGVGAWFRARWHGFTAVLEGGMRNVDFTRGSTAADQTDYGAELTIHHRFYESRWGVGAKAGIIWLDDNYLTLPVGAGAVPLNDTITEYGVVVNYFFHDHGNKISADVTMVNDNSAVRSSSAGYLWDPSKGVAVEDGVMVRLQWQINF